MMHENNNHLSTAVRSSNPRSVLNAIGAGQGSSVASQRPALPELALTPQLRILSIDDREASGSDDSAKAVANDQDVLQSTIESAKQIQQLAHRLSEAREQLAQREQDFEFKSKAWSESIARQECDFDRRSRQLQQQSAQVRLQQRHVMQLQDDIVKSHDASKAAIEMIVENGIDSAIDREILREMRALQQELGGRFDYITRRWEHLYRLLEDQRVQTGAVQSIDDRVKWT